jgi:hypothetical protein
MMTEMAFSGGESVAALVLSGHGQDVSVALSSLGEGGEVGWTKHVLSGSGGVAQAVVALVRKPVGVLGVYLDGLWQAAIETRGREISGEPTSASWREPNGWLWCVNGKRVLEPPDPCEGARVFGRHTVVVLGVFRRGGRWFAAVLNTWSEQFYIVELATAGKAGGLLWVRTGEFRMWAYPNPALLAAQVVFEARSESLGEPLGAGGALHDCPCPWC